MDAQKAEDSGTGGAPAAKTAASYPELAQLGTVSDHERRFRRACVFMTGVLMAEGKFPDVWVHDLSANGARVRVRGTVPDALEFRFRMNGIGLFRALLCWRDGNILGIRFLDEPENVVRKLGDHLTTLLAK